MAARKNRCAMKSMLRARGVDFNADYHALGTREVDLILDAAKVAGYRKPKTANGSRARYFFYNLARQRCGG